MPKMPSDPNSIPTSMKISRVDSPYFSMTLLEATQANRMIAQTKSEA